VAIAGLRAKPANPDLVRRDPVIDGDRQVQRDHAWIAPACFSTWNSRDAISPNAP
jgi:hypothetical protein